MTHYGHVYTLKISLEFKLLALWRKKTPFLDQKCTYEKVPKKLGMALPPPSFGQNPKEQLLFSVNRPLGMTRDTNRAGFFFLILLRGWEGQTQGS